MFTRGHLIGFMYVACEACWASCKTNRGSCNKMGNGNGEISRKLKMKMATPKANARKNNY